MKIYDKLEFLKDNLFLLIVFAIILRIRNLAWEFFFFIPFMLILAFLFAVILITKNLSRDYEDNLIHLLIKRFIFYILFTTPVMIDGNDKYDLLPAFGWELCELGFNQKVVYYFSNLVVTVITLYYVFLIIRFFVYKFSNSSKKTN